MELHDFLAILTPSQGWLFAARPTPRGGFGHAPCDTHALLTKRIEQIDQAHNAYFALGSYKQPSYVGKDGKTHFRTKENAAYARAVWLDIDCGPGKPYATKRAAAEALKAWRKQYAMPWPTFIVDSGNGLHVYWAFTQDIKAEHWPALATRLAAICKHGDLKIDPKPTTNIAAVLRPITTTNKKDPSKPKSVRLLGGTRQPCRVKDFGKHLSDAIRVNRIPLKTASRPPDGKLDPYTGGLESAPADAQLIAEKCQFLRHMRDTQGADQTEPEWFAALSILAKCEDGEELAHTWSEQHPGYDAHTTQAKFDAQEQYKPQCCDNIRAVTTLCEGCPVKVNSPIALGYSNEPVSVTKTVDARTGAVEHVPELPEELQKKFRWTGDELLAKHTKRDKVGNVVNEYWAPVSKQFVVPQFMWVDDSETYMLRCRIREDTNVWIDKDISLATVNMGGMPLYKEIAGKCGVLVHDKTDKFERFMKTWTDIVRANTDKQTVRRTMGWQEDGTFLLGSRLYLEDGTIKEGVISSKLLNLVKAHELKGDLDRYKLLVDALYNKKDREVYQFSWAAAFGSVLPPLFIDQPQGLVLALVSGKTGLGKTSIAKAGIGVWGNPHAQGQSAKSSATTELALYTMAGQRHHLPTLLDEITTWNPEQIVKFLYNYSDGTAKLQAKAEGGLRDNSYLHWTNTMYVTSNTSPISLLSAASKNAGPQIARIFEIQVPEVELNPQDSELAIELLQEHHAIAGDAFIRYVVQHKDKVVERVKKYTRALNKKLGLGTDARYWVMQAACTIEGFMITRKLGLHQFDTENFLQWLYARLLELKNHVADAEFNPIELASDMINDLMPGMLVTDSGRGTSSAAFLHGFSVPRGPVTGRLVLGDDDDDSALWIPSRVAKKWCAENKIDYRYLMSELKRIHGLRDTNSLVSLTKNLTMAAIRVRCWSFNPKLFRQKLKLPNSYLTTQSNVVSLSNVRKTP